MTEKEIFETLDQLFEFISAEVVLKKLFQRLTPETAGFLFDLIMDDFDYLVDLEYAE